MTDPRPQRRLAAIMAADVVSYTRLMDLDEAGTLARLKALRSELFDPRTEAYGGRIFKNTGDGALAEFPSATDAVQAALDIQHELAARNADLPEAERILLRVGISLGDVIVEGDDLFGNGVNIAARMEALAAPGSICVSANVYEHVAGAIEAEFEDLGEQEVKNLPRPVRCYQLSPSSTANAVTPAETGELPTSGTSLPVALPDKPSIAVLPFNNMSGDPEQEFFADGMTEDIITLLSQVPGLFVIARNSTFAYKGQSPDVRAVAADLGVRYILEGSVRKGGNRIRITAQFIDAETGNHIWANRYDRVLDDIFEVQDEVTAGIVGALQSRLLVAEASFLNRRPTVELDAWGNVVRAKTKLFAYRRADLDEAEPHARRAIEIDPNYAEAYAVLAHIMVWRSFNGWTDDWYVAAVEASELCDKALSLTVNDAAVLTEVGSAYQWLGRFQKARALLDRAHSLNPNAPMTCSMAGLTSAQSGQTDAGIALTRKASVLSAKDPLEYMFQLCLAHALFFARDFAGARDAGEESLLVEPHLTPSLLITAAAYARLGDMDAARARLERLRQHGSPAAIDNMFRPRPDGTLWAEFTGAIKEVIGREPNI
jgi:adenylate cyclase